MTTGSEFHVSKDRPAQRLHRSASDRLVAGVCGGIAEYLSIDPSLVRIAFVVATLWGVGLLIYVVLAIILPVETSPAADWSFSSERSHALAGTVQWYWAHFCWRATWAGRRG